MDGRQLDRRRLALVAARFQSPFDGEKLAALEAFRRVLEAGGATWSDLIAEPKPAGGQGTAQGEGRQRTPPKDPQDIALDLARTAGGVLTAWELDFLKSVAGFRALSDKQIATLTSIRAKVERMARAAP